jgi:hypothetical protein
MQKKIWIPSICWYPSASNKDRRKVQADSKSGTPAYGEKRWNIEVSKR